MVDGSPATFLDSGGMNLYRTTVLIISPQYGLLKCSLSVVYRTCLLKPHQPHCYTVGAAITASADGSRISDRPHRVRPGLRPVPREAGVVVLGTPVPAPTDGAMQLCHARSLPFFSYPGLAGRRVVGPDRLIPPIGTRVLPRAQG